MKKSLSQSIPTIALALCLTSCATLNQALIPQRNAIREIVLRDLIGKRAEWAANHPRGELRPLFIEAGPVVTKDVRL